MTFSPVNNKLKRYLNNIVLKQEYSIASEAKRVFYTLQKIEWYKKMGYQINLPGELKLADPKKIIATNVKKIVSREYGVGEYKKTKLMIKSSWDKISREFAASLLAVGLKPEPFYMVLLTKYGVGGSYNLPNHIILNFRGKSSKELAKTIMHEIIHLLIEPLIKRHKISHWAKERIADLILFRIVPNLATMQHLPIKTKGIDKIFNNLFPNIDKIIKNTEIQK